MKLLITGGLGYLGGRLAQFIASQGGYEILLGTRQQVASPHLPFQKSLVQTRWDSPADLEQILAGVDVVVHLAGMNAQDCGADPVAALDFNGVATARLLNAAVRQGVKRFIYLSTAHVYGSPLSGAITEDTCPRSLHPYATSHRAGEDAVRAAHQSGEIEGIVIRLSNSYGVPADKNVNCWTLLVNDLCRQAAVTRKLVLRSSGLQLRDFVTLQDAVRAVEHFMVLPRQQCGDGVFNLGGEYVLSIYETTRQVAARCEATLGFNPPIERSDPQPDEQAMPLEYSIAKLKATGFSLAGKFEDEVDATLTFCQKTFGK